MIEWKHVFFHQICAPYQINALLISRTDSLNFKPKFVHPIKNFPLSQKIHSVSPVFSQPIKI